MAKKKSGDVKFAVEIAELANPLKLKSDHLSRICEELSQLEPAETAAKAIRYVVDGTDDEVLLSLRSGNCHPDGLYLTLTASGADYKKISQARQRRATILRPQAAPPAEFLYRLARVYEAVSGTQRGVTGPSGWPGWLLPLLIEVHSVAQYEPRKKAYFSGWKWSELEAMLAMEGIDSVVLAEAFLQSRQYGTSGYAYAYLNSDWLEQADSAEFFTKHAAKAGWLLQHEKGDVLLGVISAIRQSKMDITSIVPQVVDVACADAKGPRDALRSVLKEHVAAVVPLLQEKLSTGSAGQRSIVADLLYDLQGVEAIPALEKHLEDESSERVQQTIRRLISAPTGAGAGASLSTDHIPLQPVPVGIVPLGEKAVAGLRKHFDKLFEKATRHYEQQLAKFNSPDKPGWMGKPEKPDAVSDQQLQELIEVVEGRKNKFKHNLRVLVHHHGEGLGPEMVPPDMQLVHLLRYAAALDFLNHHRQDIDFHWWNCQDLESYRARCEQKFGLRELELAMLDLPNIKPGAVGRTWLQMNNSHTSWCDWEPEAVWPYFAERLELLEPYFGPSPNVRGDYRNRDWLWSYRRKTAFTVLALFPALPPQFIPKLWDMALGGSKADRLLAQKALVTVPGKAEKVIIALADGKQDTRGAAADWLGEIGDPAAIEPLKEAFLKEKQEAVKGQMLQALDALGANVNEFLDRKKLLKESEQGLKKKLPKGAEWLPLESLPAVHWADSGEAVNPAIVKWWVVQSVINKSPTPGPLVRRYLDLCRPLETAALAKFLLTAWIGEDTRAMTHEEASAKAEKDSSQQWRQWGTNKWFSDQWKTQEGLYKHLYGQYSTSCLGSAVGQKGILAIVSAVGDRDCVKLCEQYIRKWFGQRLSQCKALLEVLAWAEDPLAIQVLLSIGTRFRTKAIQKAANEYVQELADRQGWTLDQLADRTLPDAGFEREMDEQGQPVGTKAQLVLDYGPRKFIVTLDDELEPIITKEDGKAVKSPPAPAKSDDAELAKAAKKAFSDAKKTVKELVKRQGERFYEAVCTNRRWKFVEWERYLLNHPIVGRLCPRLVWIALSPAATAEEASFVTAFRPLEDGSFTDHEDNPVTLEPDMWIGVAHSGNVTAELDAAWTQHLEDYDVQPLFAQFGRPTYRLPVDKQDATEVTDFQGHMLTTFKLRGKATKLGWVRGEIIDGGGFDNYFKSFPSLGINALLEFTGSYVPEGDIPCAIRSFYFLPVQKNDSGGHWNVQKLPLKKIPPVLLSEIYGDVRNIAAEGTGFDADWEKKGLW